MSKITFTEAEVIALQQSPVALRELANWHDCKDTENRAIADHDVFTATYEHERRSEELCAVADSIEANY